MGIWLTEALRLHCEEHLSRVEADRRLGMPKTTVCSLFVRFRGAARLSWLLLVGMSEQGLTPVFTWFLPYFLSALLLCPK